MRSDLLVHWTGHKDIDNGVHVPDDLSEQQAGQYVARLADILSSGLWFSRPEEQIFGAGGSFVGFRTPTACFTEVKLSQSLGHARKYGFLGVVVDRRFVLDRFGGPVHYLRNHSQERFVDCFSRVGSYIQDPSTGTQEMFDALSYCASYLKGMSNRETDDFDLLDEHEWRVAFSHSLIEQGKAKQLADDKYAIPIQPIDIQMIVFPNSAVRSLWLQHENHKKLMDGQGRPPIYLTLKECDQF